MILLEDNRIARTIKRMSLQIAEEARGNQICLIGLNVRGYAIAKMMHGFLDQTGSPEQILTQLDADGDTPFNIPDNLSSNAVIVLVDDVVFSGLTIYRAMQKFPELTDYYKTLVAALTDRGHRRVPVHVQVTGIVVPTKFDEHIELVLKNKRPHQVVLKKAKPD